MVAGFRHFVLGDLPSSFRAQSASRNTIALEDRIPCQMLSIRWFHIVGLVVATALLCVFIYAVRAVLPPFLIAFAVAWLLDPLLDKLEARRWPRMVAVAGVYVGFLAVFVVALVFIVPAVIDQSKDFSRDFPAFASRSRDFASGLIERNQDVLVRFHLPTTLQELLTRFGESSANAASHAVRAISTWVTSNLSKVLWFVLVPLIAFYFLNDIDRIRARAVLFIPEFWRPKTVHVLCTIGTVFTNYVRGLLLLSLIYGATMSIILMALGLKYGIILGILAGILYTVPYVGALVTAFLVLFVGLATYSGAPHAIWTTLAAVAANQVFDNLVTPKILGRSVGIHPVLSLFALLAGGHLFGLVGMILAVPVAASIQEIVLEFYPGLRDEGVGSAEEPIDEHGAGTAPTEVSV